MRASRAGVSVVASWPACLLNSPASRCSRNRLLQRLINASLQSSLSRIAAPVWFGRKHKHQPPPPRVIGTPATARRSLVEFQTFRICQHDGVFHEHHLTTVSDVTLH